VACGDSGNDILMLEGAERGVVVGNAQVRATITHLERIADAVRNPS